MTDQTAHRKLSFRILRYNPQENGSTPRLQRYELEEADGMTLFIALNEIREQQDPSLQFDFVSRLPHAHQEPAARDHACATANLRVDRRPVGQYRPVDAGLG